MVGRSVAHYQITEKIGSGGMGEVYRARDTRLEREVALKVLPETFAREAQRMARFAREAQVLASLNHPNIAAIYGVEEAGGIRALVLELVEGETLRERIAQGPIPVEDTLPIAIGIAEALEAAHEKGVIHRDLKPANVKITPEGTVKVLDFGLAKALEEERQEPDISESPTLSMAATRAGMILGTAGYMSPEQARGRLADRRSDIWSFGVVLFEMLTGQPTFNGETLAETLAAVMLTEPDLEALPRGIPPGVRGLLERCLCRDPRRRLQHIGEARIALERALEDPASGAREAGPASAPTRALGWRLAPWALAALTSLVAAGLFWQMPGQPRPRPLRLKARISDAPLFSQIGPAAVLSPDGQHLAFVAGPGPQLYSRDLETLQTRSLSGTAGARNQVFSPDGRWIAFAARGRIMKVASTGGAPIEICDASGNRGIAWDGNDHLVFGTTTTSGLFRVSASGGAPEAVTTRQGRETSHRWPWVLPEERAVIFTAQIGGSFQTSNIEVQRLDGSRRKTLVRGGYFGRYLPTGHLTYVQNNTLFAVPFDARRLETVGSAFPVLEGISGKPQYGAAQFSFSTNGTMISKAAKLGSRERILSWTDPEGHKSALSPDRHLYSSPRLSPDGRFLVLEIHEGSKSDIWIRDIERETMTRFTFDPGPELLPIWSPDDRMIVFHSTRDGGTDLYWKPADGSGAPERLTEGASTALPGSISPDGKFLAFCQEHAKSGWDLWILPLQGERTPKPFLQGKFTEVYPEFSPDGRWIAYMSDESGQFEIYVRPFPGPGGKHQVSGGGGTMPRWSRDGKTIFYTTLTDRLMSVPVRIEKGSFRAGKPQVLFEGDFSILFPFPAYDPAPDGSRFLTLSGSTKPSGPTDTRHVTFVFNWFQELRRLSAKR